VTQVKAWAGASPNARTGAIDNRVVYLVTLRRGPRSDGFWRASSGLDHGIGASASRPGRWRLGQLRPQHFLYFFPEPQGHGSLRPTLPVGVKKDDGCVRKTFDILHLDGWDVSNLALIERKAILEPLVSNKPGLQFSGHHTGDGELILKHAGKLGFEGVVSKTIDAPYAPGNRGRSEGQVDVTYGGVLNKELDRLSAPLGSCSTRFRGRRGHSGSTSTSALADLFRFDNRKAPLAGCIQSARSSSGCWGVQPPLVSVTTKRVKSQRSERGLA
jgi:hypothetical protein